MNTNYTTIALLFTLSLAFHPAMAKTSPDQVTESSNLSTEEQQRVATLTQLSLNLAAYYQAHLPTDAAPYNYDYEYFNPLHWLACVGDGQKDNLPQKVKNQLATVDYTQDIPLLLKSGIDVNAATPKGLTPLMLAASAGHTTVVKHLLSCPRIAVNAQTRQGATALMLAAHKGHTEVVELLLACTEVDINAKTKRMATALMLAAHKGHADIVELLLACTGIDINAKTSLGESALIFAASQGHVGVVKQLLAHPAIYVNIKAALGTTPLMFAAYQGHTKVVKQLLAHPAIQVNTEHTSYFGVTDLMIAAYKGRVAIVKQLLAHSQSKINAQTLQGDTALDCALYSNHPAISKLLENRGGKRRTELALKGLLRDALYSFVASLAIIECFNLVAYYKRDNQDWLGKIIQQIDNTLVGKIIFTTNWNALGENWQNRVRAYCYGGGLMSIVLLTRLSKNFDRLFPTLLCDIKTWEYYAERIADRAKIDLVLY